MWQKKAYVLYWWRNRLKNLVNSLAWTDSLEKTLMLGKFEGRRKREQQRMRCLDGITDSMDMSLRAPGVGDGSGSLACCSPWGYKSRTWLSNWTELNWGTQWTFVEFMHWTASMSIINESGSGDSAVNKEMKGRDRWRIHMWWNLT